MISGGGEAVTILSRRPGHCDSTGTVRTVVERSSLARGGGPTVLGSAAQAAAERSASLPTRARNDLSAVDLGAAVGMELRVLVRLWPCRHSTRSFSICSSVAVAFAGASLGGSPEREAHQGGGT